MDDREIVDLYWRRSQDAVPETAAKYGAYCRAVACNILANVQDAEECVNDTWLGAWNSMPANRPERLRPYLAKLTRWLALTRLRDGRTRKRGGGETDLALEELDECLPSDLDVEAQVEAKELAAVLHRFLAGLEEDKRQVFLARYWFLAPVKEIAEKFGYSEAKIKSMLLRARLALKKRLEEENYVERKDLACHE